MQTLNKIKSLILLVSIGFVTIPLVAENSLQSQARTPINVIGSVTDNFGGPLVGVTTRGCQRRKHRYYY